MKPVIVAAVFIGCLGVGVPYFGAAHQVSPDKIRAVPIAEQANSMQPQPVETSDPAPPPPKALTDESLDQYFLNLAEISNEAEKKYIGEIRKWLATLPEAKAKLVYPILVEAHPAIHELRQEIYNKRLELMEISYKKGTPPETLPRLGQQLQKLRQTLREKLNEVNDRIRKEAMVEMGPLAAEGFWLHPITKNDN